VSDDLNRDLEPERLETETEQGEESTTPPSTRDVLEAAWDHLEDFERKATERVQQGAESAPGATAQPQEQPQEQAQRVRDPHSGRFTAKPPATKGSPSGTAAVEPREPGAGVQPPSPAPAPALHPPRSWRPVLHEAWSKMDPAVQREVIRREREMDSFMQTSAQARQFADEWTRTLEPYSAFIRATGQPPARLIASLFQTAQALTTQNANGKAAVIANLIRQTGVPVEMLAQALDNPSMQPAYNQPPPSTFDPRVDVLMTELRAEREHRQQEANLAADTALDTFLQANPQAEQFLEEMADYMEVAARRGVDVDYASAYNVILNAQAPDVAAALRAQAQQEQPAPVPAHEAASSVRSEAARRPERAPKTNREAAERAWEKLSGGRV
jgi:hypothetical protein